MILQDLKIGTRLGIGIGIIIVFVLVLGGIALLQAENQWQSTRMLYEHPLTVSKALSDLRSDIQTMEGALKDLVIGVDPAVTEQILGSIDTREADAFRQIDIVRRNFLGPREDVENAARLFTEWKAIRSQTIALVASGRTKEALARFRLAGVEHLRWEGIYALISTMSSFANAKAEQFYTQARTIKNSAALRLGIMSVIIIILSSVIGFLLFKGISDPLVDLTRITERYRRGDESARSQYAASNEIGTLAASFNALAQTVQFEKESRRRASGIADVMLRETELDAFCAALLKALIGYTDSLAGAIYILNADASAFELHTSVGLGAGARKSFSATEPEGEFGSALASGRPVSVTAIPAESRFIYSAVSGDILPRGILTIPVSSGNRIEAVISLAGIAEYTQTTMRLVDDVLGTMMARFDGVRAYAALKEFSKRLELANRELGEQKRELGEQNRELEGQKIRLDEASKLKSSFLSNMSHELRTPLNSVIALSGVLYRKLKDRIPDQEYSYLEVIERNGRHLLSLINDILDLSRIEAGREELTIGGFTVAEPLSDIVAMLGHQAAEKGISLINRSAADSPPVSGDADKFRHIMQNLIGNAVKFTEKGGVTIDTSTDADEMRIRVADTGIGIAPEHLPFIFDEFRQADGSTSRKYGGSGLGLAIARKYARLMYGDIEVASEPGSGSVFTLVLPLSTETRQDAVRVRHIAPDIPVPKATQDIRLLLVEDSEPAIIQMTDILHAEGYSLSITRNGREALDSIAASIPDALILDLMMPEVDGFEVLRTIRAREETSHIPVIVLTARQVTKEEVCFLKDSRIARLIRKGDIGREELLAAVRRMVPPSQPAPEPASIPASGIRTRPAPGSKPRILVVEDNPDNMQTARALLCDEYELSGATDGDEALSEAARTKPDLILLDISLPGRDGFEVFAALRQDEVLKSIPVIALTARAMRHDQEEISRHGFDAYLSKPLDAQLLARTLKEFLDVS